ncbi:hypothetical protein [Calothrix sp. NIES-2098]|uniref:hypothetical protein n=1 Tax=Calothrix sp. NIES-2098 TaxID=1954171 RepID=UPI000B6226EE|nr:hypothetical protein NIES2098_41720 [Calothrix sp. NIES-2098]
MKTINSTDDITLIHQYIQGETRFSFNQNLRIEAVAETIQLLTKNGFLLATINLKSQSKFFLVRQNSNYWELINQVLLENSFMPRGKSDNGLMRYEYYPLPVGYQMYYTEARQLWKLWRSQMNQRANNTTQLDLLVFDGDTFHKIQEMAFCRESVYIKTTFNEILIENCDRVLWMSSALAQTEPTTVIQTNTADEHIQACEQLASTPAITTNNIVNFSEGKLYIQTPEGEIVVEGSNLKFSFTQPRLPNIIPQAVGVK